MRTLCKKALALCVVFALALTCFVGTLSVSAADPYDATLTVADVDVNFGDTTATAVLHIAVTAPGINEAIINIDSTIGTIDAEPTLDLETLVVDGGGDAYVDVVGDDFSKLFLSARRDPAVTELNGILTADIAVEFTLNEGVKPGTYPINIVTEGVKAADKNETVVNLVYATEDNPAGNFIVTCKHNNVVEDAELWVAPTCTKDGSKTFVCDDCKEYSYTEVDPATGHAEELTYTSNEDGTHAVDCPNCEDVFEAEECVDNDANNICDKCAYAFPVEPEHEHHIVWESIGDGKHTSKCDAEGCDDTFVPATEDCADEDADNACDKCGYVMVTACTHANKTLISATAAIDANTPGLLDYTCDDCGETEEVDETVEYYMYYSFSAASASYASQIMFNLTARKDLLAYQGEYTDLFVYFEKDLADADAPRVEIVDVSDATSRILNGKDAYQFSIGVAAKELTDSIRGVVFLKYNGQWYNGMLKESTVAAYCKDVFNAAATSEKEKILIADVLSYGAAAQKNFRDYNIDNLATSVLTAQQLEDFATSGTTTAANNSNNPFDPNDKEDNVIVNKFSLSAESIVTLNYTFNTVYYQDSIENLRAVFTYVNNKGEDIESVYVYKDIASAEQLKYKKYFTKASDISYGIEFAELEACDMRKVVNLKIYSGERLVSCGTDFSVESQVARLTGTISDKEATLYNEMLQYGDSAAAFFS